MADGGVDFTIRIMDQVTGPAKAIKASLDSVGKQFVATKRHFENLIYLEADRSTFELGATIYRELRRAGLTIRNSIDCLIAATVIQHGVNFLEHDRDYKFIDQHFPLNRI